MGFRVPFPFPWFQHQPAFSGLKESLPTMI